MRLVLNKTFIEFYNSLLVYGTIRIHTQHKVYEG